MTTVTTVLIVLAAIVLAVPATFAVSACMLASRISQELERRKGDLS